MKRKQEFIERLFLRWHARRAAKKEARFQAGAKTLPDLVDPASLNLSDAEIAADIRKTCGHLFPSASRNKTSG